MQLTMSSAAAPLFAAGRDTLPFPATAAERSDVQSLGELMPQVLARYLGPQVPLERTEKSLSAQMAKAMAG